MRILLHIGYPKTATTYLQRVVFPLVDPLKVNYISYQFIRDQKLFQICNSYLEGINIEEIKARFNLDPLRLNLISYEGFIGNWRTGALNQFELFRILKAVFGDHAKILLVLRNQPSMVLSLYKQLIQEGGTSSFPDFLSETNGNIFFNKRFLDYNAAYERLKLFFKPENIHIIPYELFNADPQKFINLLEDILECDLGKAFEMKQSSNKSLHDYLITFLRYNNFLLKGHVHPHWIMPPSMLTSGKLRRVLQRRINHRFYKYFGKGGSGLSAKYYNEIEEVKGVYVEGNRIIGNHLKTKYNISIEELGYE